MKIKFFKLIGLSLSMLPGLFLSTIFAPSNASASGFAVYPRGAEGLAMQHNVIAHTEGPNSNYYNPALITELKGTQIESGITLIYPSREFESDQTGKTEKAKNQIHCPGALSLTHQLSDRFTMGISVFNPFGLGNDWGKKWEGRYLATNSELLTFNINPNIAWKVNDRLAVAGGLDFLYLDATLEKNINFSTYGLPDGKQKFEGDGNGFGYNLGLIYYLNEDWSFGTSYRSEITVDAEGDAKFRLPQITPALLKSHFPNTDGSVDVELPAQLFFGLCYKGIDKLTVELGGRWEGWSCYEKLAFKLDQPIAGSKSSVFEKNWNDVMSYSIGAKYDVNDSFAILAGYRFEDNPVPNDTFEPAVLGSDAHSIAFGVKKRFGKLVTCATYNYQKYDNRKKNNNLGTNLGGTANGEYSVDIHLAGVSIIYEF
jgi:long-chain fatty acid transport protein